MIKLFFIPSSENESASMVSEGATPEAMGRAPMGYRAGRDASPLGVVWFESWSVRAPGEDITLELNLGLARTISHLEDVRPP